MSTDDSEEMLRRWYELLSLRADSPRTSGLFTEEEAEEIMRMAEEHQRLVELEEQRERGQNGPSGAIGTPGDEPAP